MLHAVQSRPCTTSLTRHHAHILTHGLACPLHPLQCLDLEHFCLSGHAMSCPDGTKCTGKPGPQSPCRSDHKPVTCPKGEWGCTTVR